MNRLIVLIVLTIALVVSVAVATPQVEAGKGWARNCILCP